MSVSPNPDATATDTAQAPHQFRISRYFSRPGTHPFDEIEWDIRTATIGNEKGETVFEQRDVEVPKSWSQLATNVVVSKYFHGPKGSPQRERSARQLVTRVVDTITEWGDKDGYFLDEEERETFRAELTAILINQRASFNSPVWFNIGVPGARPQASACFINSVRDEMESILDLAKTEGMLFKWGSGTGTNLSPIRSSREALSSGGTASGPVSFMRGYDTFAGSIKSGGKTRRAAKMVILNIDHPDIREFILCKVEEEKKARILIEAGYDPGFNVPGGAYDSVHFQNANNSVRVTDEFMRAVENDGEWQTHAVVGGRVMDTYRARDLMQWIAESAHMCGDPGIQYDTTINNWHTCPNTDRIHASNPCSEYMFLNDSACNLASLNLMAFRDENGEFDIRAFRHAIRVIITAQEILVGNASYPTPAIERNSHDYRPLGLGYANLGALLMARGLPYDSDEGRAYAGAVTALMTGEAYRTSAHLAARKGPFAGFAANREAMLGVIRKHGDHVQRIDRSYVPEPLFRAAETSWREAYELGERHGFRNAQATVLAPTGTIGFMMDCDTTGIEPDMALVKYKKLVGGGALKTVNTTVPLALATLGYTETEIRQIVEYIDKNDTIEGAPFIKDEHLPVFDCAFKPVKGTRSIHYMGHVRMMSAVQPFISGAISKTVNMPETATVEEVRETYMQGWKLGLKAIAIYRDNCKSTQPVSTKRTEKAAPAEPEWKPRRRRLPDERNAMTHKFSIAGHEGYITVGMYEDGQPGEIFIVMSKVGSTIAGLMDAFATMVSLALQYGVPLKVLADKFSHSRFEPAGFTNNPQIPMAKSIMDYIFRWLALKFLPQEERPTNGDNGHNGDKPPIAEDLSASTLETRRKAAIEAAEKAVFVQQGDAPLCPDCGSIMIRSGACYKCLNCGGTSGCS
ncbi:MAG TPA: vitamin B12-dependent ribonucleotide reductase [Candidatus Latescibacteria bacterium]|nr:vitamin B12-dependent ribonucleotide reductase [Candidatus Latescibacterota bacterium]